MVASAPRLDPRVTRLVAKLDDTARPIAATARLVATEAEQLGCARPSYERIRQLVHVHRAQRRPSVAEIVRDVSFRTRPPDALLELLQDMVGEGVPGRRLV